MTDNANRDTTNREAERHPFNPLTGAMHTGAASFREFAEAQALATHVYSIAMHARQIRASFGAAGTDDGMRYDEFVSMLLTYLAPKMDQRILTLVKAYVLERAKTDDHTAGSKPRGVP